MRKRWLMVTGQIKENGNQGRTEGVEGVLPPPEQLRGVYNFEFLDFQVIYFYSFESSFVTF